MRNVMSTDAIPAAVPGPNDPPDTTTPGSPAQGLLASMLAPVDPARPTFDLTPTAASEGAVDAPVTGGSSASYHGDGEGAQKGNTASGSQQKTGIVRAWLLAGATRWAKGGGAQNKRLDVSKAQAQAHQLKEARQTSINRTNGLSPKGVNATGAGGKSLGNKGASNGAAKKPQNSNGSAHQGPAGRSGGNAGSGPGGSGGRAPSGKGNGPAPKTLKGDGSKNSTAGAGRNGTPGGGKNGPAGTAGNAGKSGAGPSSKGPRSAADSKGPLSKGDHKGGKQPDGSSGKGPGPKGGAGAAGSLGKSGAPGSGGGPGHGPSGKGAGKEQTHAKGQGQAKAGQKDGKPFSTRESREAGYRDGTRTAKAIAHAKAYRDGTKDGYRDTAEVAERDKARLDKAYEDRKKAQDKEQPVSGSSADYHKPEPIEVTGVTGSHVLLGDGAAKNSVTRGEVRSLKTFERRMKEKSRSMAIIAEGTKGLKVHAETQAKKATTLLEAAKGVEGGEKLTAALVKLEDDAKVQVGKAEEIHKRAVRAAEACGVVLANVETRYGGMYKAVVDSDETAPAELAFYKG